jgi:carbon-monoxide dehydrogenase medium subunit
MKPAPFEYLKAQSVEEAVDWLARWGESAKILAGGQSLLPLMKLRLARPERLIDINGILTLARIEEEDHFLKIGALVRHYELEENLTVRERCPLLAEAAGLIGHPQIRHLGTLGGSVCHADPCAELPTVLTALEAEVVVQGPQGKKKNIKAGEFFLTYLTTVLGEAELLIEVMVPKLAPEDGWSFLEVTDVEGGLAVVGAAAILKMDKDGVCGKARLALGGVAPTPLRIESLEEFLEGRPIDDESVDDAAGMVGDLIDPESDMLHTADHKRALARALTRRALKEAVRRAET